MIGRELNSNHRNVHDILTEDSGMQKICTKLVPKNLINEQKGKPKEYVPGPSSTHRK